MLQWLVEKGLLRLLVWLSAYGISTLGQYFASLIYLTYYYSQSEYLYIYIQSKQKVSFFYLQYNFINFYIITYSRFFQKNLFKQQVKLTILLKFKIAFSPMLHPIIKWAQRKDRVFIEIALRDITQEKIDLTQTTISFQGISDKTKYAFDFELFAPINTNESKWSKTGFHLLIVLQKKETDKPFWPRVTQTTAKNNYIQIDWAKWVDEDQEEQQGHKGLGGYDPSQMQGFRMGDGGFPGMGGNQEDEQQQQANLDDLQKPQQVQQEKTK